MKRQIKLLAVVALAFMLVGCKASEEKISEAENTRNKLIVARDAAEETYLDIADTSMRSELDALGVQVAEIEAIDFSELSNKKIDEKLPVITQLIDEYNIAQQKLTGTYQEEAAANEELAKNVGIDAYVINKTGLELDSIKLHDLTTDNYSDDFISNGEKLLDGYTLMGIKLQIHADSTAWEFVVKDSAGKEYVFPCESLTNVSDAGVSLVFDYDEASGTGTVTFGGYFSN